MVLYFKVTCPNTKGEEAASGSQITNVYIHSGDLTLLSNMTIDIVEVPIEDGDVPCHSYVSLPEGTPCSDNHV